MEIVKVKKMALAVCVLLLSVSPLAAQGKRLFVLRATGEMVEYDLTNFASKQAVKLPPEAAKSPGNISVNRMGQILFAPAVTVPLTEEEVKSAPKFWFWNGHAAITLESGSERTLQDRGSNQEISESAVAAYLSEDGNHLFWFANQAKRLQREQIDLSTTSTWQAWRTDLKGADREDLVSAKLPDCRCKTGTCEESCPYGSVWVPETGLEKFFLVTQLVAGQTAPTYKESARYQEQAVTWTANVLAEPLQHVLDADSSGNVILEAIPDTGCCGWSNQSNDQTLVIENGKSQAIFDEQATYQNPDYDVSFFTSNAKLSPELGYVGMTIASTVQSNKPVQLAEEGQANPEESQRIHKALAELPAVAVKSREDAPRQIAFVPRASLVGWISERELLIVEGRSAGGLQPEVWRAPEVECAGRGCGASVFALAAKSRAALGEQPGVAVTTFCMSSFPYFSSFFLCPER